MQEGWKCPACGCGNAPFALTCGRCEPVKPLDLSREWAGLRGNQSNQYRPFFCSACGCEPCNGTTTACKNRTIFLGGQHSVVG